MMIKRTFLLIMICGATLIFGGTNAYAEEKVKATDSAGHELLFEDDGIVKMSGDCFFYINGNFNGKILLNDMKDGRDNFSEVENGKYTARRKIYRLSYLTRKRCSTGL